MSEPIYAVNDRVRRKENREQVNATVIAIDNTGEYPQYELSYDEGGTGWWPESEIEPIPPA